MALQFKIIPVTQFQQNCSLIWCDQTHKAALVDPGGDVDVLAQAIKEQGVELESILLTHGHLDHAGGANGIKAQFDVPIIGPQKEEQFWLGQMAMQCQMFGFPETDNVEPDQWLEDGDTVSLGNEILNVIFTPGHTPGHIVFYSESENLVFVGDVLFAGSIGRTDFPKGHHQTLIQSITQKLFPLGDEVKFVPGHGPMSTLGRERQTNPFVSDSIFG